MSSLVLEIDQTLQQFDPFTSNGALNKDIRFPLVQGDKPITDDDVARLQDEA
jgi:hypothetical protein